LSISPGKELYFSEPELVSLDLQLIECAKVKARSDINPIRIYLGSIDRLEISKS
jgi:hypothetical protein